MGKRPKKAKSSSQVAAVNTITTQAEAEQKCCEWIQDNKDKVLHLYSMMMLGLCNPKVATQAETKSKDFPMPDIPVSKTTLGQVSSKHIISCVKEWHPDASEWINFYGAMFAHELFYFGTHTDERVNVFAPSSPSSTSGTSHWEVGCISLSTPFPHQARPSPGQARGGTGSVAPRGPRTTPWMPSPMRLVGTCAHSQLASRLTAHGSLQTTIPLRTPP